MAGKGNSATIWWIIFIAVIAVLTALFLYPLYQTKNQRIAELEKQKSILAQKEEEQSELSRKVDLLNNSPHAVEKEAREKFMMARPGEKVLFYEQKEEK